MADLDDLREYLPGRSRKPDTPKPSGAGASRPGGGPRRPASVAGTGPGRRGAKKPEPTPPPKWRAYANNPAVVAALFAMAVLAFVTRVPGAFRARPPYDTHPCCGMNFFSCKCGCQHSPLKCTCPGHKAIEPLPGDIQRGLVPTR